jgi:hypothetical protein
MEELSYELRELTDTELDEVAGGGWRRRRPHQRRRYQSLRSNYRRREAVTDIRPLPALQWPGGVPFHTHRVLQSIGRCNT